MGLEEEALGIVKRSFFAAGKQGWSLGKSGLRHTKNGFKKGISFAAKKVREHRSKTKERKQEEVL